MLLLAFTRGLRQCTDSPPASRAGCRAAARYSAPVNERAVPILPSRDLRETLAFFETLGFENRGAPPEEWDYLILGRGGIELHLYEDKTLDPLRTASMCYLFVEDADRLFDEWAGLVLPDRETGSRVVDPVDTEYGMREFAVVDRSGNLIRIGSEMRSRA